MQTKTYGSKNDLYRDYAVALKFGFARGAWVHRRDYKRLEDAFARSCRARLNKMTQDVENFNTQYPTSAGFFVEMPVEGDTGEIIGTRFVLLEHETGWELFIPVVTTMAVWLGPKIAEKVAGKALETAVDKMAAFMKKEWQQIILGGKPIDHVEIRTQHKGVMRIAFSYFEASQVQCLLRRFPTLNHLNDCNEECFGGLLVEPPSSGGAPQATD